LPIDQSANRQICKNCNIFRKNNCKQLHAYAEYSTKYNFSSASDAHDFYPYLGLSVTKIDVDGVSESNNKPKDNMFSLKIENSNNTITSGNIGFRTKNNVEAMERTMVYTDFGVRHNFSKPKANNHVVEAYGKEGKFHVKGNTTDNIGIFAVGLHTELDHRNSMFFEANGEISKNTKSYSANIGYRLDF